MTTCRKLFQKPDADIPLLTDVAAETTISSATLKERIVGFASLLTEKGVRPGDTVAVHLYNSIEFIVASLAAEFTGAVTCFIDPLIQPDALGYYIADSGASLLVTHTTPGTLPEAVTERVAIVRPAEAETVAVHPADTDTAPFEWDDDRLFAIYYTSGTTSTPKGVMLTAGSTGNAHKIIDRYWQPVDSKSRHLAFVPFSHGFGSIHIVPQVIRTDGRLFIMRSFHPANVVKAVERYGITHIYGVPSHYQQLLRLTDAYPVLKNIEMAFCAAAKLEERHAEQWHAVTGVHLSEGYGLIETSTGTAFRINRKPKASGHFGRIPDPDLVEFRILDEENRFVSDGEEGEIVVRGKSVMKGYLNKPEETAAAFYGDWFRTGDKGYISREKELFMTGRIKDIVNVAGIKISPYEVEAVLNRHEAVDQTVVTAEKDELYGEVVKAFVRKLPDAELTERELIRYSSKHLMNFQVPKKITFLDSFPLNKMGKIDRKLLRKGNNS